MGPETCGQAPWAASPGYTPHPVQNRRLGTARKAVTTPVGDSEGWELVPYDPEGQRYDGEVRRWFSYFQPSELAGLLSSAGFQVHHQETVERFKPWWHAVLAAA